MNSTGASSLHQVSAFNRGWAWLCSRLKQYAGRPLKAQLVKLTEHLGFRIERIKPFDRRLKRLLHAHPRLKFVQVGANDGVRFDGLYFKMTAHRCPGLVIEPLPDVFERLRLNYLDYPEVRPLRIAVHPTQRKAEIFRVDPQRLGDVPDWAAGIASFTRGHHRKLGISEDMILSEVVECAPLMEVLESSGMLDADLLQIDTEGFDSEVLKMIDFARFSPSLIKFEYNHMSSDVLRDVRGLLSNARYILEFDGNDIVASRGGSR